MTSHEIARSTSQCSYYSNDFFTWQLLKPLNHSWRSNSWCWWQWSNKYSNSQEQEAVVVAMRAFLMQAIWLSHSNYTFRLPECEAPKRDHPAGYRVHQVQVSPIAATGQLHESRHKVTEAWTFLAKIAAGKGPMNYRTARATECTFGKTSSKKKG